MMSLLMFQFIQIQCLCKVTIVYCTVSGFSSYSDFSRDLYILPAKKACVISQVFCLSLWGVQRPVSNNTFHSRLYNNLSIFPLFITHPFLYVLCVSLPFVPHTCIQVSLWPGLIFNEQTPLHSLSICY